MSEFLEKLKQGMTEAQQKFATAHQRQQTAQAELQGSQARFNVAQAEFQSTLQEFQAFQTLVNAQTRKEQPLPASGPPTPTLPPNRPGQVRQIVNVPTIVNGRVVMQQQPVGVPPVIPNPQQQANSPENVHVIEEKIEKNKTQAVRDLLRQHPAGMRPADIWQELKPQMSNRTYLYSILKRLKDRGDAKDRKGKYFLTPKAEDNQEENQGSATASNIVQ